MGPWVQAPLGLAGGHSSTASKQSKAVASRVELWGLESQALLGGNESGQARLGGSLAGGSLAGAMSTQGQGWPAPGQRLYL